MANLCGVRFKQAGKVFYFDAGDLELGVGAYVVADTAQGLAVGRVVITPEQVLANENRDELKPLVRLATPEDIERDGELKAKAVEAAAVIRQKAAEMELPMSIAGAEYDLSGGQLTAFFTAPDRIDFRNLVKEVSRELDARVQLLQVGERDRAKLVDGYDICGERLCCSSWMTTFPSVSIRMAKEQDLPLNPQKISGVCGRLYCCLTFEYEDYKALRGTLPKVGSVLSTPAGEAKVSSIDFNREVVKLWLTDQRTLVEVAAVDLQLQHGVTVRPMELVRKLEGALRVITEDTSARGRISGRSARAPREPIGQAGPAAPAPPVRGRRGNRPPESAATPGAPGPQSPRPPRPAAESATTPPAPQADQGGGQRRRRRRRGRSGGGGEAGPGNAG